MTASEWADLEILLHRSGKGGYAADLRFYDPRSDDLDYLHYDGTPPLLFNFQRLAELMTDPRAYGKALSDMLFADQIRQRFKEHRAQLKGLPMRVRLAFGTDAAELQALHWEALRDPALDAPLLDRHTPFSRYVSASTFREASRQYRDPLRTIIAIANPSDLPQYELAPIDTEQQLACARRILKAHAPVELVGDQAGFERLSDELRRGCDLLYIVAHGGFTKGEYMLWLTNQHGEVELLRATELLECIRNLIELPRLVVLMACQSGGTGQGVPAHGEPSLVALGPLIAEAGVPAVLAMHGQISIGTATGFLKVFVEELRRTGVIDDAAAAARVSVQRQPDAWMPVLFMRSKSGVIWHRPRPPRQRRTFDKWGTLITNLRAGSCVPILGPGLLAPLMGSTSEIARQLATKHNLGMVSPARESLPQVAQLLQLRTDRTMLRYELSTALRENLARRCPGVIPADNWSISLYLLLKEANQRLWGERLDPHRVLAQFPCPLFVNAAPDPLLEVALQQRSKQPQLVICPWTSDLSWATGAFDPKDQALNLEHGAPSAGRQRPRTNSKFLPDDRRPIVYHPFGILQLLSSLVLTEDDYFQYLVGNTMGQAQKLSALPYLLTNSALLFIGFRLDDWSFRVILREILQLKSALSSDVTHIGVQIDPATSLATDDQSYSYLEEQLRAYNITIYWNSTDSFLGELDGMA
jgi:hypothetical protein